MNTRVIPCPVCRTPLEARSIRSQVEGAPELLQHATGWFGIMKTEGESPRIGMLLVCSEACAEHLSNARPIMQGNTPIGVG